MMFGLRPQGSACPGPAGAGAGPVGTDGCGGPSSIWSRRPSRPAASNAMSTALALKASLFEELLGKGRVGDVTEAEFLDLAAFITPVRRRIGPGWRQRGSNRCATRLDALLDGWSDRSSADRRLAGFVAAFPQDREHRWVRDLGAEVLHFTAPDRYPLMTRWVWDARSAPVCCAKSGSPRMSMPRRSPCRRRFATFATLRDELRRLSGRRTACSATCPLHRPAAGPCLCRLHQRPRRPVSAHPISPIDGDPMHAHPPHAGA